MGPNLAIHVFQTITHIGPRTQPNAIYLHFKLKHTLDLGPNQMQYIYISNLNTH